MQHHPITLAFNEDLEKQYREKYFKDSLIVLRIALLLGVVTYSLFGYLEANADLSYRTQTLVVHFGIIIPFLAVVFLASFVDYFERIWQLVLTIAFIGAAASKIYMITLVPDNYVYYTGLIVIYSAGYFVFKLRFIYASIAGWTTFLMFNLTVLISSSISFADIIAYNFFYLALNLFGMLAAYNLENSNRNNYLLTSQLNAKESEELRRQVELANKSAEFKQNFLANMSHEIRTPLTGLVGMIELLGQTPLNHQQQDYINTLKQSTENLHEIINQVLDYSKIEAGKLKLNIKTFQFQALLINAKKLFSSICDKEISFEIHVEEEVPLFINADKSRIMQVINNLISNAVKFTSRGKISLNVKHVNTDSLTHETTIKIEVADTGLGIKPEKHNQLFIPFAQIDEMDTRDYDGTGLGLSICKELVKLHGGDIGFESEYKVGSTFWFTFKAKVADWEEMPSLLSSDEAFNSSKSLRIMLVEDKKINQKVISLMLSSIGHKVTCVNNGEEALSAFVPGAYDMILMDVQMPVMDGIAATQALKEKYADVPPVVGLSANAFEGDSEKYKKLGMDDYITKPLKYEDFTEVVNKFF
ncbi:MAG: response regulator [Bacteroidetes bacterium]|nr:response regulator [Bacteroidota bacterium]